MDFRKVYAAVVISISALVSFEHGVRRAGRNRSAMFPAPRQVTIHDQSGSPHQEKEKSVRTLRVLDHSHDPQNAQAGPHADVQQPACVDYKAQHRRA